MQENSSTLNDDLADLTLIEVVSFHFTVVLIFCILNLDLLFYHMLYYSEKLPKAFHRPLFMVK